MQGEVSTFRLYLMRGLYLLIAVGLGSMIWPLIFHHKAWDDLMHGVAVSLLAALSALAVLGIRYPLQMLPLLLFELLWKVNRDSLRYSLAIRVGKLREEASR